MDKFIKFPHAMNADIQTIVASWAMKSSQCIIFWCEEIHTRHILLLESKQMTWISTTETVKIYGANSYQHYFRTNFGEKWKLSQWRPILNSLLRLLLYCRACSLEKVPCMINLFSSHQYFYILPQTAVCLNHPWKA